MNYKPLVYDKTQIMNLYQANNWTNYTKEPQTLFQGIQNSLETYACYHNDHLVGLIRVVGDGETIIYIQDLLVDPMFHRQGIGKTLVNHILKTYQHVRQIVLTTDNTDTQKQFYEACGFVPYDSMNLVGFYQKK